jgi:hypothetical protein
MKKYLAREICNLTLDELWALPGGDIVLQFDDGELITSIHRTQFCYYCWFLHRDIPEVPLLVEHHIGMNYPTDETAQTLMERIKAKALETVGYIDHEYLALRIKQTINDIYNDFTENGAAYVTTIWAEDFIDVLDHPEIAAANSEIQQLDLNDPAILSKMEHYIEVNQRKIRTVLMRPDVLSGNRLAETIRSGIVSIGQILQCVGLRGFPTDIDSNLFPKPIVYGYADGITRLEDSAKDSRSAAKALMFTKDPLSEVEYFNRQMQLVVSTIRRLWMFDDCGSTDYIPWQVRHSSLTSLLGAWFKDPESSTGELKEFKEITATEYLGKTILLRNPLTCQHPDIYGICGRCFGELRHNIPLATNIGHCSVVVMCEKVSQNVLSTKHLDGTAVVSEFKLTDQDAQFIRVFASSFELGISSSLEGLNVSIIVGKDAVANIADINLVEDACELTPNRVSEIEMVLFKIVYPSGDEQFALVPISMGSRLASFSGPFLNHIKRQGFHYNENRDIEISLDGWDRENPIWVLPRKHASMLEFMGRVEDVVKSSGKAQGKLALKLDTGDSLSAILTEFHDVVGEKFSLNLAHLGTILRSTLVRSKKEYDYRPPEPGGSREIAPYNDLMFYRSLTQLAAYQQQADMFRNPQSYTIKDRPTHGFDGILVPLKRR